jgi:hypothetical protein
MAKPVDLPTDWSTTASYPAEVYPSTYPAGHPLAGEPHPLAGNAVPWSGQPTTDTDVEATLAPIGLHPGKPIPAPGFNSWIKRARAWLSWVKDGSSAGAATAHICETDAAGKLNLVELAASGAVSVGGALAVTGTTALADNVTLAASKSLTGGVDSSATFRSYHLLDAGTSLPPTVGEIRRTTTAIVIREPDGGAGKVLSVAVPGLGFLATASTALAIDDIAVAASKRLQASEPVWLRITFGYRHTAGGAGSMSTRIKVTGTPGSVEVMQRSFAIAADTAWRPFSQVFRWTPTDDFVLPGTVTWSFQLRAGSNVGATLELRDLGVEALSNIAV